MKITAIKPHYNAGNRKPYLPPPVELDPQGEALKRYAALSQILFDALVPMVDEYERINRLPEDINALDGHVKYIKMTMGQIRQAQAVLRMIGTDVYA